MECDEDEDANSLLSLSQTFLQPDSSSSTISLSTNQLHSWSTLTSTATDAANQFSPISPVDVYNAATNTGHIVADNETNFRVYGSRTVGSQSASRSSMPVFSRTANSCVSSLSTSNTFQSAGRVDSNCLNHNSGHMDVNPSTDLCYEQSPNLRSNSIVYGDKDIDYSNRVSGSNGSSNTHHTDDSNIVAAASFSQAGYNDDHNLLSLTSVSVDDGKLGNHSGRHDQKMFDPRSKDYSKDLSNLYEQSTNKPLQSTEITMSFDRRDATNFDSGFEFPGDSRDFTTARLDVSSISRSAQDQEYHQSQKYIATQFGENDVSSMSLSLDTKRVSSSYMNFGLGSHVEDTYSRMSNSQKKSTFTHQLVDLPSDLEHVFHGYPQVFEGHQKLSLNSNRHLGVNEFQETEEGHFNPKDQTTARDSNSRWSGRPRAHRKMARLLGNGDHRSYSQMTDAASFHKPVLKCVNSLESVTLDKSSYQQNAQRDLTSNSRTFLTMEEELDLRTNHHQQRNVITRKDDSLERHQTVQRELGLLQSSSTFTFDANSVASSMHKDTASTILASQQFLPSSQLDLDFHSPLTMPQSQKDLDLNQHFNLQVSKDFSLDASHSASNQDDLSFDHTGDSEHVNQPELSLPDNLGMVSHVQPELSFEAYFNSTSDRDFSNASDRDFTSTSERDLNFGRKMSMPRELNYVSNATVNDFNIEDYMNPQTQRDLSHSYFSRTDLPQDMTVCQKISVGKTGSPESFTPFKGREKCQNLTREKDKQGEISELQKELTKTSTKESMKGIRIPRDINRAMEILQGLQEDERAEERRKEQQRQQHQHLQGLVSSPKKAFQNKHNVQNLSLTDQQFLGSSATFMEEQCVGSFLDNTHLTLPEQSQESLQMVGSYQHFTQLHQPLDADIVSALPCKRDDQHVMVNVSTELDSNILRRLACSASMKGPTISQNSFSNNTANLVSMLTENPSTDQGIQFPVTGIHFQNQQPDLDDVISNNLFNTSDQSSLEITRSKNDMSFMDFEPHQPQQSSCEKSQTSGAASDLNFQDSLEITQLIKTKHEAEVLISSRKCLYDMMKQELFCDALLSTSKQTVKVHQVVLCSMSQYLTALLLKMKPHQLNHSTNYSSVSSFVSQTARNSGVLLVVNCDGIKSSSMMSFLLYIYLGKAELSESNVLDMYILACSLRVPTLKDLCKEYMWQAHISSEQIKVPQLIVSNQRLETHDEATNTEINTEDKSTNTSHFLTKAMEVATQTDRSTSEAGEGSQDEWVMLKKTKQKTVSPSKCHLPGKSLTGIDSPVNYKTGKKGWLSPKRRYKSENLVENKLTEKELVNSNKDIVRTLPVLSTEPDFDNMEQLGVPQSASCYTGVSESEASNIRNESVQQDIDGAFIRENKAKFSEKSCSMIKQSAALKKSSRTTVEIAAAAAAARLAAHSYGTRTARGNVKVPVSYAALASGIEKKKVLASAKEKILPAMSKKKDFIKSNPDTEFSQPPEEKSDSFTLILKDITCQHRTLKSETVLENMPENTTLLSEHPKADAELFKSSVKRPFKKSIVHRSRSEEVLNKNYTHLVSGLQSRADVNVNSESDFMDTYLIDSLVNTMEGENAEVDFQKVISELDTLSKSPLLTTASSSVSSTSLTSPLKSPVVLQSTSDSSSPFKSKSTPQGFRKRLIHQINSEKSEPSLPRIISSQDYLLTTEYRSQHYSNLLQSSEILTVPTSISQEPSVSIVPPSTSCKTSETDISEKNVQSSSSDIKTSTDYKSVSDVLPVLHPGTCNEEVPTNFTESVDELALSLYSLGEDLVVDGKASSFSSMTDIDLGLKEDCGPQFFHKIFKRKKKLKVRKLAADCEGSSVKVKLKKMLTGDSEGGTVKPRLRKATGSDTEGGAARSKQKKNVTAETEGVLAKVRPPPKKRAKMELELLKAEDSEKHSKSDSKEIGTDKNLAVEMKRILDGNHEVNLNTSDEIQDESSVSDSEMQIKNPDDDVKKKSQRRSRAVEDFTHMSEYEITMETKLTVMLEDQAQVADLKSRQFTCKLCQTKFRSARRTVKHMRSHGLLHEYAMENISVGEKESGHEACDICGYKTKDQTYHYMHLHKYFKHKVPLPLGWSTKKCEICGKECFSKFQLKEHMMSHDDSHFFACEHCGQTFKMRNSLNSHVFHKHSNIRKHECKVCDKTFKTWTQLKVHVRSHTGEKPFACAECGHRSTTQGNLKFHLTTHGYSKEKIQEIIEQTCKNVTEMNPEALEKVMLNLAQTVKTKEIVVKDSKKRKNTTTESCDQTKPNIQSATKDGASSIKKIAKKKSKEQKSAVSKFAGSQIEWLLTQPLSELKPPKFILPQLPHASVTNTENCSETEKENDQPQMLSDSADSGLGTLMQQQNQEQNEISSTEFFIALPCTYYWQQQQQQQQQQTVGSLTPMMTYTVNPTHAVPSQVCTEASVDLATGLALPVLSTSDILSSELNMLQTKMQSVEVVQSEGIYTYSTSLGSLQCQESETTSLLACTSQGHEILQDGSVASIQYPDSKILVIDSTQQEMNTNALHTVDSASGIRNDTATMMVLPSVSRTGPQNQPLHQVQTLFSYPSLISSNQSVLLPITSSVQIIPSGLDTGSCLNFSVSVPEEAVTLNVAQNSFEDSTAESILTEPQENVSTATVSVHVGVNEGDNKCDLGGESCYKEEDMTSVCR